MGRDRWEKKRKKKCDKDKYREIKEDQKTETERMEVGGMKHMERVNQSAIEIGKRTVINHKNGDRDKMR